METATVTNNYLRVVEKAKPQTQSKQMDLLYLNMAYASGNIDKIIMPDTEAATIDFEPENKGVSILDGMHDDDKVRCIKDIVRKHFGIQPIYHTNKREQVLYRQTCMYLIRNHTKLSLSKIGKNLGGKDHATVLHGCKAVNNMLDTDKRYQREMQEISTIFGI